MNTLVEGTVTSYIAAMHAWEVQAEKENSGDGSLAGRAGMLEDILNSGDADKLEARRQSIINEFCTQKERISRGSWGTNPSHHSEDEIITRTECPSQSQAFVFTEYTDASGYTLNRRYDLLLHDGVWLIDQHWVLHEDEELPELY